MMMIYITTILSLTMKKFRINCKILSIWRCKRGHFISRCSFINPCMHAFYVNNKKKYYGK